LNFGGPVDRLSELLQFLLHPLQDLLPRFGTVRISMGKLALGVAGRWTNRSLPKATVADTLRKHVPEPHKPNGALRPKSKFLQ
jgi:hypothetical protein